MKGFVIFTALLASAIAFQPKIYDKELDLTSRDQRLVTDAIASVIQDISRQIREAGLDPLDVPYASAEYDFPVKGILQLNGHVKNLRSFGLSHILINRLDFNALTLRLRLDIELPRIVATLGEGYGHALIFDDLAYDASVSGDVSIRRVRITGEVRVSIGIISGISIRNLDLDFTLGGIDSDLTVNVFGRDMSDLVNTILSETIPSSLAEYRSDLNRLIVDIVLRLLEDIL